MQKPDGQRVAVMIELFSYDDADDPNKPSLKPSRAWIVSPKVLLPLDTNVNLMVEPGIYSSLGPDG